ncbi:hypothetical protein E1293_18115 [Actinomadura darangshiensis]|uniref:Secreted protein n=1 Tax=Actinomadura darangshiensis TaxID=705336 RepID=A0A4R5B9H3_9ACTN|nr:hypothetical protein [Actinomadura darangshiensis]TDD81699.1 hypothetical protein E1293_18115 [Actinomadura darangshiensis]
MRLLRTAAAAGAAMLALAACDSGDGERRCTAIGSMPGLSVVVPDGSRVASASLRVCWGGACQDPRIELTPTSKTVSDGCEGDDPDDVCGAHAVPDGGKSGFARVGDLPKTPVQVTLKLRDAAGRNYFSKSLDVTPRATFPNGPHCGEGDPQAVLTVANGQVTVR